MNYLKNFMTETTDNEIKKLVTHDGSFHSDDIFACATLCLMLEKNNEKFTITRTRNPAIIKTGDYVFDIGGIYDAEQNKFDHHQIGGAGKRENGIEYSSFGLVWKKFGKILTSDNKAVEIIDKRLAAPIDAFDNGFDLVENKYEVTPYYIQHLFFSMKPTWKENNLTKDVMFLKCVEIAKVILAREIIQAQDLILAEDIINSAYQNTVDKRIIVLDKHYPWEEIINNFSEPLFVIYPRETDNFWTVEAVKANAKSFVNRKNLPKLWAGLSNEDLQNVSSVSDAVFCHRGLFMAVAKTKQGAMKLAQIAVES